VFAPRVQHHALNVAGNLTSALHVITQITKHSYLMAHAMKLALLGQHLMRQILSVLVVQNQDAVFVTWVT